MRLDFHDLFDCGPPGVRMDFGHFVCVHSQCAGSGKMRTPVQAGLQADASSHSLQQLTLFVPQCSVTMQF